MKITPLDIRRQEFNRKVRGIDPEEVETFLELVANEYEMLLREHTSLKEQVSTLRAQVESFREMEKTLKDTLLSAQKARDEVKTDANKEAEYIIREAELRAERWIEEARQEVAVVKRELIELNNQKVSFVARMRGILSSQEELLKVLEMEVNPPDKNPPPSSVEDKTVEACPENSGEKDVSPDIEDGEAGEIDEHQEESLFSPSPDQTDSQHRPNRRFSGGRNTQT